MISMTKGAVVIAQIKKWFEPPIFPGDEEKTSLARMINTVQLYFLATLSIATLLLVPLLAQRKLESYALIMLILVLNAISRVILFRGHPKFASTMVISVVLVLFGAVAVFSGGIGSPLLYAVIASAIVGGLLINPRSGMLFVIFSALAGLAIALLQQSGLALPLYLHISPIAAWFLFALALFFLNGLMGLVIDEQKNALARERQQNAARQQIEQALRQSEERFQMFMRFFPGLAYIKDANNRVLFANQGFETYLGITPQEMIGKDSRELFDPDFGEKIYLDDQLVLESGNHKDILEEFGGRMWSTHKFCINQQGARPLLGGVTLDITERIRAEQALRENEEKLTQILANVQDVSYRRNLVTNFYDYVSPAILQFSGFTVQEMLAMPFNSILERIHPQDLDSIKHATSASLSDPGRPYQQEYRFRHQDGQYRWLQDCFTTVFDEQGRPAVRYGSIRDITELKGAEEKIRASLEEKETLLREIHHRVKNNLQVIIALIGMQSHLTQDAPTRQFLKELEGQTHSMALVYEQLYLSENLSKVDMEQYLRQLTATVLDTFGYKNAIQLDLAAPLSLDVTRAMPCGLIVNELFTNSLKHAFPPGFQGDPAIRIQLCREGETVHLAVSDNGVGLPRGFEWQSGRSLGLRLVNLWATHQLGGTLDVSTEAGTTFAITFGQED